MGENLVNPINRLLLKWDESKGEGGGSQVWRSGKVARSLRWRGGPFDFAQGKLRPPLHESADIIGGVKIAGRILGLDVGARRIGVAVSDPLGITAQGLDTLQRRNKRYDFEHLRRVIREYDIKEIVVGLPLRMSGAEGIQADKMQGFAEELRKRFRLPVHLWDERLTSAEANRLLRETDLSIEKRGKAVDRMAAVLILQGWMECSGLTGFTGEPE